MSESARMPGVPSPEPWDPDADEDGGLEPELEEFEVPESSGPREPPKKRRLGAAMLAGAMLGLQEALEGPKEQPSIVEVNNGPPNDDDPLAVDLDPYDPSASIAVVRPWLRK